MSGHSKWSKVKHQKESTDAAKGKIFTKLSKSIIVAVKEGGGNTDPESNFRLRLAIEKARGLNMPKDNIERAIEKGSGKGAEENMYHAVYEAFGPGGIGLIIEAATDSKQRTVAELKNLLDRSGGVLAGSGAVSHMFKYLGQIITQRNGKSTDELLEITIESGASDMKESDDEVYIYCHPNDLHKVKQQLESKIPLISTELTYIPVEAVSVDDPKIIEKLRELISTLEQNEDIQKVHTNVATG